MAPAFHRPPLQIGAWTGEVRIVVLSEVHRSLHWLLQEPAAAVRRSVHSRLQSRYSPARSKSKATQQEPHLGDVGRVEQLVAGGQVDVLPEVLDEMAHLQSERTLV